jgi:hypothetical protein
MWLTHLAVNSAAGDLTYDLAVDATGRGRPSREAAGLVGLSFLPMGILLAGVTVTALARRWSVR